MTFRYLSVNLQVYQMIFKLNLSHNTDCSMGTLGDDYTSTHVFTETAI